MIARWGIERRWREIRNWYYTWWYIPVPEAAARAAALLRESDWGHMDRALGMRGAIGLLYYANAFLYPTKGNPAQVALPRLQLYEQHCDGPLERVRGSFGRVRSGFNGAFVYLDDWNEIHHHTVVKRSDLRRWIALAKTWKYLEPPTSKKRKFL